MAGSPRHVGKKKPYGRQVSGGAAKKKQKQLDGNYSESGQTIGSLETFVRLWVAEKCFEIIDGRHHGGGRWDCLVAFVGVVGPLLLAGQCAGFYSELVAVAVGFSCYGRWSAVFFSGGAALGRGRESSLLMFEGALVDLTLLLALFVERLYRVEKKRLGNFEREIVASFAPTVAYVSVLVSFGLFCRRGGDLSSFLLLFAYARSVQRYRDETWKFRAPTRAAVSRAAVLDDVARVAAGLVVAGRVLYGVMPTSASLPALLGVGDGPAAVSRLYATVPAAATEALDSWIFMDFVFLLVTVFAGGVSLKRCVAPDDAMLAANLANIAHALYRATIGAFFVYALFLDRKPQDEISHDADFDRRITIVSRRMLDFAFARDQAAKRFKLCHAIVVTLALIMVISDLTAFFLPPQDKNT